MNLYSAHSVLGNMPLAIRMNLQGHGLLQDGAKTAITRQINTWYERINLQDVGPELKRGFMACQRNLGRHRQEGHPDGSPKMLRQRPFTAVLNLLPWTMVRGKWGNWGWIQIMQYLACSMRHQAVFIEWKSSLLHVGIAIVLEEGKSGGSPISGHSKEKA